MNTGGQRNVGRVTEHREMYIQQEYVSQSQSHHLTNPVAHTEAETTSRAAASCSVLQPYIYIISLITRSQVELFIMNYEVDRISNTNMRDIRILCIYVQIIQIQLADCSACCR